jgi:hypothetical protein
LAQYGKSIGSSSRPTKLSPNNTMPADAIPRAPKRSESAPAAGPAIRNPAVSGSMKIPAHNGVSA